MLCDLQQHYSPNLTWNHHSEHHEDCYPLKEMLLGFGLNLGEGYVQTAPEPYIVAAYLDFTELDSRF